MATKGTPGCIRRPRLPVIAGPPQSDPNSPVHGYQEFCNGIEICTSMDSPFDSDDVTMEESGAVYLSVDEQLNRCVSSDCLDTTSMDIDICTLDNRLDWREEQLYSISDNESNSDRAQCEEEPRDDFSDIESANKLKAKLSSQGSSEISEQNRRSTELEKFFDEMGIEKSVLDRQTQPQQPLESVSSVESPDARSLCSRESKKSEQGNIFTDKSFIVERNSRIMRWLNNVKKTHAKAAADAPTP